MRKTLLIATALCLATSAMAQTNPANALTATQGNNSYSVGSEKTTVYWKYQAKNDYIATFSVLGSSDIPTVSIQKGVNLNELQGTTASDWTSQIYAFKNGETYFFTLKDVQFEAGFTLNLTETSNVGAGLSEDNPVSIKLGSTQILGNPVYPSTSSGNTDVYTTYTAEESGQLRLTTEQGISSATVNGESVSSTYEGGKRIFKIDTTKGETYKINFNISMPLFVVTSEVVQVTAGSIDAPFDLNKNEFTVPAAAGKYYYTYKPEKKGYINITSDADLTDGQVKVFRNKFNANDNKYEAASSEVGSYNIRTEVTSTSWTYYIVVDKKQDTTDAEKFNFSFEDYQPGETEDNPITVTVEDAGTDITLPSAEGTYYYGINVPANTNKMLAVKANSDLSSGTTVSLYKSGSSWNAEKMSNGFVQTPVNNTTDATYIIKVESSETSPLSFKVAYADVEAGSLATSPKEATASENTIDFDGTEYYTFKATRSGKLAVTVGDGVTVRFPEEAGGYATNATFQRGNTYFIEATKDTQYFITVSGVTKGSTFTLAETDFDKGEAFSNPIVMEGDTYVFDENTDNLWLKYNVTKTGIIDLNCDVPYNWSYSLNVTKKEIGINNAPVSMVDQDANYNTAYRGIIPVTEGETLYIQVNMAGDVKGRKLTLTQRDPEPGEAYSNPIVMEKGNIVDVSKASSTRGIFLKAKLKQGDNIFRLVGEGCNIIPLLGCSPEPNGITYAGNAAQWEEAQVGDQTAYQFHLSSSREMDCYIYINSVEGKPKLAFIDESTDGIANIEAAQQDGTVVIYDLNGRKLNQISGNGVYIIKSNGETKKVVIKK